MTQISVVGLAALVAAFSFGARSEEQPKPTRTHPYYCHWDDFPKQLFGKRSHKPYDFQPRIFDGMCKWREFDPTRKV